MDPFDRSALFATCHAAFSVASDSAVAKAWNKESACAGMTVGGLAHHLLAQVEHVVEALDTPPTPEAPIALLDHYARAEWVEAGHDDEANVSVRASADESATAGRAVVLTQAARALGAASRCPERSAFAGPRAHTVAGLVAVDRRLPRHPVDGGRRAHRRPGYQR